MLDMLNVVCHYKGKRCVLDINALFSTKMLVH
jgi:hypothetical protein